MKLATTILLIAACCFLIAGFSSAIETSTEPGKPKRRRKSLYPPTWVVKPKQKLPGLKHQTFQSKCMKTKVGFSIYTPPGYSEGKKRYPVIYWLHGLGGNEQTGIALAGKLHKAILSRKVAPMIMVFVNGGQGTMYSDSFDGKIMSDTAIVRELIPHVDTNYRTVASREGRGIEGFSMGGFGAMKLAFKYPEMFCSVVSGGGALHSLDTFSTRRTPMYERMFGGKPANFNANSPDELAKKNHLAIRRNLKIMMFVGKQDGTLKYNDRVHKLLERLNVPHQYKLVDGFGHNRVGLYEVLAEEMFAFHARNFGLEMPVAKPAAIPSGKTRK